MWKTLWKNTAWPLIKICAIIWLVVMAVLTAIEFRDQTEENPALRNGFALTWIFLGLIGYNVEKILNKGR